MIAILPQPCLSPRCLVTTTTTRAKSLQHLLSLVALVWILGFFVNVQTNLNLRSDDVHRKEAQSLAEPLRAPLLLRNSTNKNHNLTTTGALVHVEKTGGSTLSLMLRNGCHSYMPKPCREIEQESSASKLIGTYYHVPDFGKLPHNPHSFHVITTRDPYDRTVSAFVWHHPANDHALHRHATATQWKTRMQAYKCFPTLERLAQLLDNDHPYHYHHPPNYLPKSPDCPTFAKAVLTGQVRPMQQFYFGYQRILSLLPPNATIMATRMEHLQDDWNSINALLGDNLPFQLQHTANNHTPLLPVSRELSSSSFKERLCRALAQEYQAYLSILLRAINLSHSDLQDSIRYSRRNCPNWNSKEARNTSKRVMQ